MSTRSSTNSGWPAPDGETGGPLVLADVLALQPGGAVHRAEPAADAAERPDHLADAAHLALALRLGGDAEGVEHRPHAGAVVELFGLDLGDPLALVGIADRLGVPGVGVRRGELAGVGELEQGDEVAPRLARVDRWVF